ncbi:MAG TPA: hypothetical protein VKF41_09505 [Bryobacteraceae bacterium]|nr:hypothetical protein [Bryobacteraceae bacterium]
MAQTARSRLRFAALLLLLCLVIAAQSSALVSQSEQHEGHCCALCHVGPIPFLHAPAAIAVTPVFCAVCLESALEIQPILEVALPTGSSRAPPASSFHA